jgi:hypothetical protein
VSGPSDKAIQVAEAAERLTGIAADGLRAAHDPVLGLDRSVCLRDVTERLRALGADETLVGHIEREFGGGS